MVGSAAHAELNRRGFLARLFCGCWWLVRVAVSRSGFTSSGNGDATAACQGLSAGCIRQHQTGRQDRNPG